MSKKKHAFARDDFLFTIGYEGHTAIVDRRARAKYRKLTGPQLARKGLFKAAVYSAIYNDDEEELRQVLEIYNEDSAHKVASLEDLKRLVGTFEVPTGVQRVKYI